MVESTKPESAEARIMKITSKEDILKKKVDKI
jgi:hypothetical protein